MASIRWFRCPTPCLSGLGDANSIIRNEANRSILEKMWDAAKLVTNARRPLFV